MTLFDTGPAAPPKQTAKEKAARLVADDVAEGFHPLSRAAGVRLSFHPKSAPRYADGDGLRCGTCRLVTETRHGSRCELAPTKGAPNVNPVWPACLHHKPKEEPSS